MLLARGAGKSAADLKGRQPLYYAASAGHVEMIKFLADQLVSVVSVGRDGRSAIHVAAEEGHLAVVKFFVGNGQSVSTRDKLGTQPLHLAVAAAHLPVVAFLIDQRVDVAATHISEPMDECR